MVYCPSLYSMSVRSCRCHRCLCPHRKYPPQWLERFRDRSWYRALVHKVPVSSEDFPIDAAVQAPKHLELDNFQQVTDMHRQQSTSRSTLREYQTKQNNLITNFEIIDDLKEIINIEMFWGKKRLPRQVLKNKMTILQTLWTTFCNCLLTYFNEIKGNRSFLYTPAFHPHLNQFEKVKYIIIERFYFVINEHM